MKVAQVNEMFCQLKTKSLRYSNPVFSININSSKMCFICYKLLTRWSALVLKWFAVSCTR